MAKAHLYLIVLLATLLSLSSFAFAGSKRTNADRLGRGLPPLRPARLFDPSRTGPFLARRSGLPSSFLLGLYEDGQTVPTCYIGNTDPGSPMACVTTADAYTFTSTEREGVTPTALTVTSPSIAQGQFFTIEAYAEAPDQGPACTYPIIAVDVESVHSTGAYGQPVYASSLSVWPGTPVDYETDVFYIAGDGTVNIVWVNPTGSTDGATASITLWLDGALPTPPTYIFGSRNLLNPMVVPYQPIPVTLKVVSA